MFSGQGSQHFQMGRELFDQNAVFRRSMLKLDAHAQKLGGQPVIEAIYSGSQAGFFKRTLHTHPAIFIVEYSLAQCLIDAGVTPDMTLGASLGTFAAAAIAGQVDVEEALAAVLHQAITLESCCEPGGMIAVLANPTLFSETFLSAHSELAGVNFRTHFVISAPDAALGQIEAGLRQRNVPRRRLPVSFAFHSRWIDEAQESLQSFVRSVRRTRGQRPLVCCERTQPLWNLPDDQLARVVRQPIRFRETLENLERDGTYRYIDVGPGGTMATFVKYCLPAASRSTAHPILTPYGRDQRNLATVLSGATRQ
jgi:acyl transferase domain-containing protein